jgi:hypothetical protein
LVEYVKKHWIESETFPPRNWSIYQEAVWTNNDIEGWHNALNRHAGGESNLSLYLLIEILEREAQLTAINIRLMSERKLKNRWEICLSMHEQNESRNYVEYTQHMFTKRRNCVNIANCLVQNK